MSEFIFFHIPKCGGSSLRYILYEYFKKIYKENVIFIPEKSGDITLNYRPNFIEKIKQNPRFDFPNIKVILSHIYYNDFPDLNKSCKYKFTCVRNPIKRLISHYYFFKFPKNNIEFIDLNHKDFEAYALYNNVISNCLGITDKIEINEIDKRLKEFNYIAILENIDSDLETLNKYLNDIFGIKYSLTSKVIHENKSKKDKRKDEEKLCILLKKYCTLDELVYNRIITLKNNNIIK